MGLQDKTKKEYVDKYKAHLVAKGHKEQYRIDYTKIHVKSYMVTFVGCQGNPSLFARNSKPQDIEIPGKA
ncbi:hypothetical protein CR513_20851, partial [Mucuna pruriens]